MAVLGALTADINTLGVVRIVSNRYPTLEEVVFCCSSKGDLQVYQGLLA